MTLQSSGAISLSQVQSEFGGSNPVSMSEYYRGGSHVPTTVTQAAGSWTSYYGSGSPGSYYWSSFGVLYWNGVEIHNNINNGQSTYVTVGAYQYQRGTQYYTVTSGGKFSITTNYYKIRRRTTATNITVNTGIPSSGTIDMADFYGGRNS